jgi:endonuclease-3
MKDGEIHKVIAKVETQIEQYSETAIDKIAKESRSPFKVLIGTLISSRTKDEVTHDATERLFERAETPEQMLKLEREEIKELIYPAGFYKNKSKYILQTAQILVDQFNGKVPDTIEELVKLPGVGRKTANLVITLAFNKPGICVDTHVHRIFNRWGYIDTTKPEQTEMQLRQKLPKKYWIPINNLLVTYGQNLCTPISPHCSKCPVADFCDQRGVDQHR